VTSVSYAPAEGKLREHEITALLHRYVMQQAICYGPTNPSAAHGEGHDQTNYTEATERSPMHGGAGASPPSPPLLTPTASLAVAANERYHCQQSRARNG
jgi:hypothetical protein